MELMGNGVVLEVPLGLPNDLRLPGASGHGRRGYKRCVSHQTSSMGKESGSLEMKIWLMHMHQLLFL
jgi:hypothetical protein